MRRHLVQAGCVVSVFVAWQVATATGAIDPLLLPPLGPVAMQFAALIAKGTIYADLAVTSFELACAFGIAAILGCAVGFFVSRSAYRVAVFDPLIAGLYSVPVILLYPLYLLFFGIGPASKIALGATIAIFPIALSTIAGFAQVNRTHLTAAISMGASASQQFWDVMLPDAFPIVVGGLRMGLILCFFTILGAETLASAAGLGHQIVTMAESLEPAKMFAYIAVTVIAAILLNALASYADARGRRGME
jgi:ABC-type nitrate/sulfonate/bicarbonate transport system permease component